LAPFHLHHRGRCLFPGTRNGLTNSL
jgi:hypothetical protein